MVYTLNMTKTEITPKTFDKSKFYTLRDASLVYIFANLAPYIVGILVMLLGMMIAGGADGLTNSVVYNVFSMLAPPIGLAIVFFAYNALNKISLSAAKIKFKLRLWEYFICVAVAVVSVFGCQFFIGGIDILLVKIGYHLKSELDIMPTNAGWYIFLLFAVSFLPAAFEELIFRGMLLNGLRERFGEWATIFLSGLMFALAHGSLQQFVYPFILGVVLGWIAIRTGSTFASFLVHFLNNAIVITLSFVTYQTGFIMSVPYGTWGWPLAIILLLVFVVMVFLIEWYYYKGNEKFRQYRKLRPKQKRQKNALPVIFYISLAFGIALFVINTVFDFLPQGA